MNEKPIPIPDLRSTYQKYGQYTRNMVKVPEIWSTYQIWSTDQKYGQQTRTMVNRPEIWSTYQKYGHHTRSIVNIPEIWSKYQKCVQFTRNMVNIPEIWTKKARVRVVLIGSDKYEIWPSYEHEPTGKDLT